MTQQLIFFLTNSYDFRNPGFKSGTGHFTQIVWQETKELGMAKVKSSDGKIIVVARYRPPGNVINHFQENVNPKVNSVLSFRSDSFYTGSVETLSKKSTTAILGRSSCCLVLQWNSLSASEFNSQCHHLKKLKSALQSLWGLQVPLCRAFTWLILLSKLLVIRFVFIIIDV